MKSLHLLRHAKSAWDQPGLADHERGLNQRGRRDAPRMGRALAGELPAMTVHSSTAKRALLTLEGLCDGWPALSTLEHMHCTALYTFDAGELLDWLQQQGECDSLFLLGHNPALTELINHLCGAWELDNLPTAAYARLCLDVDHWGELGQGCAQLVYTLFPKQLARDD